MSTTPLEERVALLEREVLQLKRRLNPPAALPWWEHISGTFAETPAFDQAIDFGRRYRAAQRPAADKAEDVSA